MRRANKHSARAISFANITGGINVSQTGEQIAENEMQVCENFIYERDTKRLVGRGGLSAPLFNFPNTVKELYYDIDTNIVTAFLNNKDILILNANYTGAINIGKLTGDRVPVCCKFQNKLWIASGGALQYYDYSGQTGLHTVTSSPACDIVFQRVARLAVIKTGSDTITYSGVGDGEAWTYASDDPSTSQFIDIGYGDSGDVVSVVPLATDLITLKSNGLVYQFSGDTDKDSWRVTNIGSAADPVGICTATNIGNSVVLISNRGLKSLNTTMDYGNISATDIGDKFNNLITHGLYEPRIFHLKRHSTIMIRPTEDWSFFIAFNYLLNAATVLRFPVRISSIIETSDEILLSGGNSLFKIDDEFTTDNQAPITYKIKTKCHISTEKMLVKAIDTKFSSDRSGDVSIKAGRLAATMPTNSRKKIRCNHSTDSIEIEIESKTRFELDHIAIEVADL